MSIIEKATSTCDKLRQIAPTSLKYVYLITATIAIHADNSANESRTERFKRFIEDPPAIERLLFEKKLLPAGVRHSNTNGLETVGYRQRYSARWQSNAWFMHSLGKMDGATKLVITDASGASVGNKHWHFGWDGQTLVWVDSGVQQGRPAEPNLVSPTRLLLSYSLAEVLNMGIYGFRIGSIRWNGNVFTAVNSDRGFRAEGKLETSSNGTPTEMHIRYSNSTSSHEFTILYRYDHDTGLDFIPSHVERIQHLKGKTLERFVCDIESIRVGDGPGEERAFEPSQSLFGMPMTTRIYTNGAYFLSDPTGKLTRAPLTNVWKLSAEVGRPIYIAATALLSGVIFFVITRTKPKQKTLQRA